MDTELGVQQQLVQVNPISLPARKKRFRAAPPLRNPKETICFPLLCGTRLRTLCCGMAFITAKESKQCESSQAQSTTSAPVRDRMRLHKLEAMKENGEQKFSVCSCNWGQQESQCEAGKHIQVKFGARGAATLQLMLEEKGWNSLDCVLLDYFRFPGAYMRDNYGPFLGEMIPSMLRLGSVTTSTWLYLPNLPNLLDSFYTRYADCLNWLPITAEQHPLYVATTQLEQTHSHLLSYSNSGETKQLNAKHPFIAVRFHCIPNALGDRK
jgi:hypothetical protein